MEKGLLIILPVLAVALGAILLWGPLDQAKRASLASDQRVMALKITGDVRVLRSGSLFQVGLSEGEVIRIGDTLTLGAGAQVLLVLPDGRQHRLEEVQTVLVSPELLSGPVNTNPNRPPQVELPMSSMSNPATQPSPLPESASGAERLEPQSSTAVPKVDATPLAGGQKRPPDQNRETVQSAPTPARVRQLASAPRITEPGPHSVVSQIGSRPLRLAWLGPVDLVSPVNGMQFEIVVQRLDAQAPAKRYTTSEESLEIRDLDQGTYSWFVRAVDPKGQALSRQSVARTLTLKKRASLAAPDLRAPKILAEPGARTRQPAGSTNKRRETNSR